MISRPTILFLILATTGTMTVIAGQQTNALGFLHFKPNTGDKVPANIPFTINGTSAPSNSTRTGCNVQLSIDQGSSYHPVKALGPGGMNDYSKWSATVGPFKPGTVELEGQFQCSTTAPSAPFIHHLVHNVTAVAGITTVVSSTSHSTSTPTVHHSITGTSTTAKSQVASNNTSGIPQPTVGQ